MFSKKTRKIVLFLIILSLFFLAIACNKPVDNQPVGEETEKTYNLRFATSWAKGDVNYRKAEAYVNTLNEVSGGRLNIKIVAGVDTFAPTETIEAVINGSMDGAYSSASYYEGYVPEATALTVSLLSHAEVDSKGGFEVLNKLYNKHNLMLTNIDDMQTYCGFHVWLKTPINSLEELKGKKLRTAPGVYTDVVKYYGGSVVNIPLSEVFTALEQNLIDGYTVPSFIGASEGFFEYIKYRVDPPMLGGGAGAVFNLDVWNSLPKDLQELIMAPETNAKVNEAYHAVNNPVIVDNFKRFEEAGGQVIQLNEEQKADFLSVVDNYGWEYVKERIPESVDSLKAVLK